MAKSQSESLVAMIDAAYRIRISTAKSQQEKLALEQEKQRLSKKAKKDHTSLRWYDFAQLESKGVFWDIVSLRKPLNLGSIAIDVMRAKMAGLSQASRYQYVVDRRIEPKFSPLDIAKITKNVFGILVPSDAANDDVSTTSAATEVAQPEPSFSYTYGATQEKHPAKTATIEGFNDLEDLIEAIADGKRTRSLAKILHILRPQNGDDEVASHKFSVLLLEGLGKRMVKPMTSAQFLNLQVYMLEGIKKLRPEIDPDNAYEKFIAELGACLKAQAQIDKVAEPVMLTDIANIELITSGTPSVEALNRDVLQRSGVPTEQMQAAVLPMYLSATRLGLVPPEPSVPERLAKLAEDLAVAPSSAHGPNP